MAVGETVVVDRDLEAAGEKEEDLDAALDMELAASFVKHPLPQKAEAILLEPVVEAAGVEAVQETKSHLSFAFPGWRIDMSKGTKRKTPSISRHTSDPHAAKKSSFSGSAGAGPSKVLVWESPGVVGEACPADTMDDELLASVLTRLNVRDLCASMRTCKRWHKVACREDVWEHIPLPVNTPGDLPRSIRALAWLCTTFGGSVQDREASGYEYVRMVLNSWWDQGKPDSKYPSATFHSLIQKLVINDWSLLYEALGAAFSDRADHIAVSILRAVEKIRLLRRVEKKQMDHNMKEEVRTGIGGIMTTKTSKLEEDCHSTATQEEVMWAESEVHNIWILLLSLWRRYKRWLMLVVSHCPELNHEVMAERARGNALALTPTIYDKGIICFRSQVILKYAIRSVLQAMCTGLASAKRSGVASDAQFDLFRSADHLFQEISLRDDHTLPPTTFTQHKLRRCFLNDKIFRS